MAYRKYINECDRYYTLTEKILAHFLDWKDKNELEKIQVHEFPIWFLVRKLLFRPLLFKDHRFKILVNSNPRSYASQSFLSPIKMRWNKIDLFFPKTA